MNRTNIASKVSPEELISGVVLSRISRVIDDSRGARVVYAVVDLGPEVTSAIGAEVSALHPNLGGVVKVAIHSDLAVSNLDSSLISDDVATRFRNESSSDVVATVFSVPGSQMEEVLQSLGSVHQINEAWLCDPAKSETWALHTLPLHRGEVSRFSKVLSGLMESEILVSPLMLAKFCCDVRFFVTEESEGLTVTNAINRSLPTLRLPRDSMSGMSPASLEASAAFHFRKLRDDLQPHLYLASKYIARLSRKDRLDRIANLLREDKLNQRAASALEELVRDREIAPGAWHPSQQNVAEIPWTGVKVFFLRGVSNGVSHFGDETIRFLDNEYPGCLAAVEREALECLRRSNESPSPVHKDLFVRHRERLRGNARLYKKWLQFIFGEAVKEGDDLLVCLIRLAARAFQSTDEIGDPVFYVRLRGSEKRSYWTSEKNTNLCMYVRDRYRGLDRVLEPYVVLDFGKCWESGMLDLEENEWNEKGSESSQFELEGYVVSRDEIVMNFPRGKEKTLGRMSKVHLTWRPGHKTFASVFSRDLSQVFPEGEDLAFLLRSQVSAARSTASSKAQRPTVDSANSISDTFGGSEGFLANPFGDGARGEWNRIDRYWPRMLDLHARGALADGDEVELREAFDSFRQEYSRAVAALSRAEGEGLHSPALVSQCEQYGILLEKLRKMARTDALVRDVWEPLLQIGTATVDGEAPAMIITPWHPLRLLELASKAHQAASVISAIVSSSAGEVSGIEDFASDRDEALTGTYYPSVGLARTDDGPTLLVETEVRSGYSLLQGPFSQADAPLAEEPAKHSVSRFGEIASVYLKEKPHEKANFSIVLIDAESEDLPVSLAKHFAKEVDGEPSLRCDLTVTHEDVDKLRQIYERQNRRIGHEVAPALASEAVKTFLSRLRVGIAPAASLGVGNGSKHHDIALLHDVIARKAELAWHRIGKPESPLDIRDHAPNDMSRRRIQSRGRLTTAVYLTAPVQIGPTQAYLDTLRDTIQGTASEATQHYIPAQEVSLGLQFVEQKLSLAHALANWVVTYDRIADRRLIERSDQRLRILRYCSTPRSTHNVIVSTEPAPQGFRDRLRDDMEELLPEQDSDILKHLINAVYKRAAALSGGLLMRGSQWDNYARELLGIIVAQREVELLLASSGESRTAMFFLDEFKSWLDLSGEISDILAVDLHAASTNEPVVRLVVVEVKCVGRSALSESRNRSWRQLEQTYAAISSRFSESSATVDPAIWRNRLADMLIEHMAPWGERDLVCEMTFDNWIDAIRQGQVPVEVSGHSVLTVHDIQESAEDLDLRTADTERDLGERRWLAQWTIGVDRMTVSILGISDGNAEPMIHLPLEWGLGEVRQESRSSLPHESPETPSPDSQAGSHTLGSTSPPQPGGSAPRPHGSPGIHSSGSEGWKHEVHRVVAELSRSVDHDRRVAEEWLDEQVHQFRQAIQSEERDAPVLGKRLTPNSGIVTVGGNSISIGWLERRRIDLLTKHGIDIVRITPQPRRIAVAIKRPKRAILHLADAWRRRHLEKNAPNTNMALVIGEQEDDGELFYLPLTGDFAGQQKADPHTIVSGTTGSGKGILTSNLILDLCAFNDPRSVEIYLIDPKRGADYQWAKKLPHLHGDIVDEKRTALALLGRLVEEMEDRYVRITDAGCANIEQYNARQSVMSRIPRVMIFFDEVANWMQDDEFKNEVANIINAIATKARAAGLHLFMIYQRADNQVMTMQLRTNLGNKLVLRLGDEGSSKIALGEKGAERLLGKGHVIAKLGTDEKIYGQVPFIDGDEISRLAEAIRQAWSERVT